MRWLWLAILVGCYRPSERLCDGDCATTDVPISPDVGPEGACAGDPAGLLPNTCFDPVPRGVEKLMDPIDTDAPGTCDQPVGAATNLCFIAARELSIGAELSVRGSRPLVLWSATTIEVPVATAIDVASHNGGGGSVSLGAGANDPLCPTENVDGNSLDVPSSSRKLGTGGCGGSFGEFGGFGGGANNEVGAIHVFSNCVPISVVGTLDRVRGGCRGGHGALSDAVGSLNGGSSGGAVYLMAHDKIIVGGTIDARGTAGRTANANPDRMAGGGGGGSGGLIAFDAPKVELDNAVLCAAGGGGSSGAGLSAAQTAIQGNPGRDAVIDPEPANAPESSLTVQNNRGGGGGDSGGSAIDTVTGGGGGGGGGAGIIKVYSANPPSTTGTKLIPEIL